MNRQNRVDPEGKLVAVSARGTLMGNRGYLHETSNVSRGDAMRRKTSFVSRRVMPG